MAGLTGSHETQPERSGFAPYAKKHNLAVVFPDTSPRNLENYKDTKTFGVGYGAGFYCDAKVEPWASHFRMYTYISEELP